MTIFTRRLIRTLGAVMVTTAAMPMCSEDGSAAASTQNAANAASDATSAQTLAAIAGPGLPADFPLAPGLSACKPQMSGGEVVCDWHNVDGHAVYTFYHKALPKAGYTLLGALEGDVSKPSYRGVLGFKKGSAQGAVSIAGSNLTIQYLPHE